MSLKIVFGERHFFSLVSARQKANAVTGGYGMHSGNTVEPVYQILLIKDRT